MSPRQNEFTSGFDDIVIIDNPSFSFLDKLRLVDLAPYDETIFIDADSLICGCLDGLWGIV
jgi:alpha-N-acetylglucosamine transferase